MRVQCGCSVDVVWVQCGCSVGVVGHALCLARDVGRLDRDWSPASAVTTPPPSAPSPPPLRPQSFRLHLVHVFLKSGIAWTKEITKLHCLPSCETRMTASVLKQDPNT